MRLNKRILLKTGAMSIAAFGLAISVASAHGPERKKVAESIVIDAKPEDVWASIKNFEDITWHPAVEKSEGKGGNAVDATRTITLKGGGLIHEQLYRYDDEKMIYSYRITDVDVEVLPVTNYSAHLSVKATDDGKAKVEWRGAFYRGYPNNDPPAHLNNEAAVAAITGVYKAGLEHLQKSLNASN